jgi:hypothetical protein
MTTLTNGTIVANWDAATDDHYFSDGVRSFILTPAGLTEIFQRISTLERYNGVKYGVSDDDTDTSFTAVTDRYDFGLKGRKGTEAIEVSCQGSGTFSAAIDWRNSPQESFQSTIRCSATEFRFCIKCTDYTDVVLDRIKVRFKMEDMKSIRGVYAPPPRGQSAY